MNLRPGYCFAVAPRFHIEADWPSRLAIGSGVEERDGAYFPRGPWRQPTPDELALLVAAPTPAPGVLPMLNESATAALRDPDAVLCLFQLPEHLRSVWWALLDAVAATGGPLQGFDRFAAQVAEFLAFKRLPCSASAQMEALVTAAGERSIRRAATGQPSGLGPTVAPWTAWPVEVPESRLWGAVNLGDEDTALVMLNLPLPAPAAELRSHFPNDPPPATVRELVTRFLRAFPDYPPVRLRLGAGEGCRVPPGGLVLDGDPTSKQEPDILLLISESRNRVATD